MLLLQPGTAYLEFVACVKHLVCSMVLSAAGCGWMLHWQHLLHLQALLQLDSNSLSVSMLSLEPLNMGC